MKGKYYFCIIVIIDFLRYFIADATIVMNYNNIDDYSIA